ncbi:right-handed parallel beta-helix repeat-containing protein [Tenacibaculum sp. UWU-22]|uniref:right-handed parallel beta-helix repeat-containing protein n=1 Tax=Tenacibaculum sp. UWU-22 TaxID=3234187 RepID=UPI0034DAF477
MTQRESTSFYFSSTGDDANDGSESSPFQTIDKLNRLSLVPGDHIFFKKGDTFIGKVVVNYSGTETAPIVYDSYGSGDLPILSASTGDDGVPDPLTTIQITDKSFLEFKNLHIRNERFDSMEGVDDDKSFGIYCYSEQEGLGSHKAGVNRDLPTGISDYEDLQFSKHLYFSNLYFDKIYGVAADGVDFNKVRTSAMYLEESATKDIVIENSYFTDMQRTGIWLRRWATDVVIRNNTFIAIGGSGAILSKSRRVLYEGNIMRFCGSKADSRMAGRGSGMWVFASDDVVAQYNVSQHARGNGDSSGMHVDYNNTNILYQYNYLEDSSGGFCETLGANNNVIWRYNISVNDGDKASGVNRLIWLSGFAGNKTVKSDNVYIYNNTIYSGVNYKNKAENTKIFMKVKNLYFYNNLIALEPAAQFGILAYSEAINSPHFAKNIMHGGTIKTNFKDLDATRIEDDPLLYAPGTNGGSGYALLTGSSAIGAALSFTEPVFPLAGQGVFAHITSKAIKDFYGNPVDLSTTTNIGAFNGASLSAAPTVDTYEAEDAVLSGGTQIIDCVNASGTKAVNASALGESVTFNNINVSQTGLYLIKIFYANPNLSDLKIDVNSEGQETLKVPGSDAFCFNDGTPTSFHILKKLNSGSNTLEIEQSSIDKIEVLNVDSATLDIDENFLSKTEASLNKTIISNGDYLSLLLSNPEMLDNQSKVSIFDLSGRLLVNKTCDTSDIQIPINNFSSGLKIFVATIGNKTVVKKFIVK